MRTAGGWLLRALTTGITVSILSGCGGADTEIATGDPLHDLIGIDQIVVANFVVSAPAAHVDASTLSSGDASEAAALTRDGLRSAARVEYQRNAEFSTSNGPLDIVSTVERFSSVSGATDAYQSLVQWLNTMPGATPASTGPLGNAAHSISIVRTTTGGLQAVEIDVLWRVGNLVNLVIARGRYGGTRLNDALVLAGTQTQNETGSAAG
jgi:hypothetical protein